jgi:hypothetical protein
MDGELVPTGRAYRTQPYNPRSLHASHHSRPVAQARPSRVVSAVSCCRPACTPRLSPRQSAVMRHHTRFKRSAASTLVKLIQISTTVSDIASPPSRPSKDPPPTPPSLHRQRPQRHGRRQPGGEPATVTAPLLLRLRPGFLAPLCPPADLQTVSTGRRAVGRGVPAPTRYRIACTTLRKISPVRTM